MFKKQTTIILGAGSSLQYGYPTGKDLITEIIKQIEHDSILLPFKRINSQLEETSNLDETHKIFANLSAEQLLKLKIHHAPEHNDWPGSPEIFKATLNNNEKILFFIKKLSDLREFSTFACDLREFDPNSVDIFLKDHPRHQTVGKIMIAYVLLACEKKIFFQKYQTGHRPNGSPKLAKCDNWYPSLREEITSGCSKPEDISENNLNIITFNYDVSLDYALQESLKKVEFFNGTIDNYLSSEHFPIKPENHVYGQLHSPTKEKDSFQYTGYGFEDELEDWKKQSQLNSSEYVTASANTIKILNSYRLQENISVVGESKSKDSQKKQYLDRLLSDSENIIIIGFGFDKYNQQMLNFKNRFPSTFSHKQVTLLYHDYQGKKQRLAKDFEELSELSSSKNRGGISPIDKRGFKVIRSTAEKITNAWQDDFMTTLA